MLRINFARRKNRGFCISYVQSLMPQRQPGFSQRSMIAGNPHALAACGAQNSHLLAMPERIVAGMPLDKRLSELLFQITFKPHFFVGFRNAAACWICAQASGLRHKMQLQLSELRRLVTIELGLRGLAAVHLLPRK